MIHYQVHRLTAGLLVSIFFYIGTTSCSEDPELPSTVTTDDGNITINIPEGGFQTPRCKVLSILPSISGNNQYNMQWSIGDSVISTQEELEFIALDPGKYSITLKVINEERKASTLNFPITVNQEETTYSPYITSVPEYKPAPGQFINELPKYEIGDTQSTMNRKALESIGYNTRILISLGGYGGYVICGFDHTIVNVPGKYDFKVLGNAFYANSNPNPNAPEEGGSCEPGIVMVAYDRNKNGIADDDEWYELAGSEYNKEETIKIGRAHV